MTVPVNINRPQKRGRVVYQRAETLRSDLQSERSRAALQYWLSKSVDGRVPGKDDMDPVDMAAFLPSIILIDVVDDHQDYRFRLVGGSVRYHLAHDITGLLLTETRGVVVGQRLTRTLAECTLQQLPCATMVPYHGPHASYRQIEALMLPLTSDGQNVDRVLATMHFFQHAGERQSSDPRWLQVSGGNVWQSGT